VAFATCSYDGVSSRGVLYGVHPSAAGRGVYGDLIRFTQRKSQERGCQELLVGTQTHNLAVQKVWQREGFSPSGSSFTVHINSLLDRSVVAKREMKLCVTSGDIARCGEYSGDTNRIHFDDDFAKSAGLEGRIAHGLILSSIISKYYGTEFPGPGTLFLGHSTRYRKPVYPDREYRTVISFPWIDKQRGIYKSLVRIMDEADDTCVLSYNDLYLRPRS